MVIKPTTAPSTIAVTPATTPSSYEPNALSSDTTPGPMNAIAVAHVARIAVYSQPPLVIHGPFLACTATAAFSITPTIAAAASGVNSPSTSSTPAPSSVPPAIVANTLPGR